MVKHALDLREILSITMAITHRIGSMRITIEIDDKLMAAAMKASGAATKRETIAMALELLVRRGKQLDIRNLRGKVQWEGDLDAMRRDR